MFENESKEIVSAYRSREFLLKLPPSIRRDNLIKEIDTWLSVPTLQPGSQSPLVDPKWTNYLELFIERNTEHKIHTIYAQFKLTT